MTAKATISRNFKKMDFFSSDVSFRENGGDSFGSVFGACMSLLIFLVVALYGINKFVIMSDYADTQFNEYSIKNGLVNKEIGQDQMDFWIAFNVLIYSQATYTYLDDIESYLTYVVSVWSQDGNDFNHVKTFPTHRCNETDKSFLS